MASGTIDKPGARDIWTMTVSAGTVATSPRTRRVTLRRVRPDVEHQQRGRFGIDRKQLHLLGPGPDGVRAGRHLPIVVASVDGKTRPYSVTWKASRPDQTKPLQAGADRLRDDRQAGRARLLDHTVSAPTTVHLSAAPSCDSANDTNLTWSVIDADGVSGGREFLHVYRSRRGLAPGRRHLSGRGRQPVRPDRRLFVPLDFVTPDPARGRRRRPGLGRPGRAWAARPVGASRQPSTSAASASISSLVPCSRFAGVVRRVVDALLGEGQVRARALRGELDRGQRDRQAVRR